MKINFRNLAARTLEGMRMHRLGFWMRITSLGIIFWSSEQGMAGGPGGGSSWVVDPKIVQSEGRPDMNVLIDLIIEKLQDPDLQPQHREALVRHLEELRNSDGQ